MSLKEIVVSCAMEHYNKYMNDTKEQKKMKKSHLKFILLFGCILIPCLGGLLSAYFSIQVKTIHLIIFICLPVGLMGLINSKFVSMKYKAMEALVAFMITCCLLAGLMHWLKNIPHSNSPDIRCRINLKFLENAFSVYADNYGGNLPSENWCDLFLEEMHVKPWFFKCKGDEYIRDAESSYAMNENAVGKKLSELPADMVLLFETDLGKGNGERQPIKTCRSFDRFKVMASLFEGDEMVYPERWNQVGGSEILEIKKHRKTDEIDGCNILFVSDEAEFIKADEIKNLKWKAEE